MTLYKLAKGKLYEIAETNASLLQWTDEKENDFKTSLSSAVTSYCRGMKERCGLNPEGIR